MKRPWGLRAGFESFAVAHEVPIAFLDLLSGPLRRDVLRRILLCAPQRTHGLIQPVRRTDLPDPRVNRRDEFPLRQVKVPRVPDLVGQGVLLREAATVVEIATALLPLHLPTTESADESPAENIDLPRDRPIPTSTQTALRAHHVLDLPIGIETNERLVHRALRPHPLRLGIPALSCFMAESDILDIDQPLFFPLPIPYLMPGVPRVLQDRTHRTLRPRHSGPMSISTAVVCGWADNTVSVQSLRYGIQPASENVLTEDTDHNVRNDRVRLQLLDPAAFCRLSRMRVWPSIHEPVTVRGSTPKYRPSTSAWELIADRVRILIRLRSPFDIPPKTDITRS